LDYFLGMKTVSFEKMVLPEIRLFQNAKIISPLLEEESPKNEKVKPYVGNTLVCEAVIPASNNAVKDYD